MAGIAAGGICFYKPGAADPSSDTLWWLGKGSGRCSGRVWGVQPETISGWRHGRTRGGRALLQRAAGFLLLLLTCRRGAGF